MKYPHTRLYRIQRDISFIDNLVFLFHVNFFAREQRAKFASRDRANRTQLLPGTSSIL